MGRWTKIASAPSRVADEALLPAPEPDSRATEMDPSIRVREERLRAAAIHLDGPWSDEARAEAVRLRLRTVEPQSEKNDSAAFGELARYLRVWAVGHGYLDSVQAMRGSEIVRWAATEKRQGTSRGTLKTRRGRLVEVARLIHPADFRAGVSESAVSQSGRLAPVSDADMVMIRHYAALAPEDLRERFDVILTVVPWTGARPSELRRLRGTDIHREDFGTGEVAVVTLTNSQGVSRVVPVVDTAAARRLLDLAARRGGAAIVRASERNALNRCREYLLRRGVTVDFSVDQLRAAWLVRLSHMQVPLAYALYLADTWDTRVYRQLQEHLPTYDPGQGVHLMGGSQLGGRSVHLGGAA